MPVTARSGRGSQAGFGQALTLSVPHAGTVPLQVASQKQSNDVWHWLALVCVEHGTGVPVQVVPLYVQPLLAMQLDCELSK